MLKNDIEKTLQAHSPVPPEGFAERMDRKVISLMQQKEQAPVKKKSRYRKPVIALAAALVLCFVTAASRDLIIRPDTIRARETATPLVTALSEGKGEETDGEGEANARGTGLLKTLVPNDDSRAKMEYDWPELANSLVPVNASCEKQGIRWEMKAAAVKDDEALFVYTLKDLQGDRINAGTGILHWPDLTDDIGERDVGEKGGPVSFDEATGELLYAECIKYKSRILPEDRRVTVGFENLSIDNQTSVDLLPMLEQYGEKAETVDPPTLLPIFRYDGTYMRLVPDEEARKGVKVLDYTKPLNVPLAKDITLTGIGWVDDVLHVQLHYANNREGRFHTGITSPEFDFLYDSSIRWDENNDGVEEWVEFMSPDKLSGRQVSSLSAKIIENTGTVKDKWEVQIPLADILLTAEGPAAREEETESGGLSREDSEWLMNYNLANMLDPRKSTCEKDGIRLRVLSAVTGGYYADVVYSIENLEKREDAANGFYPEAVTFGDLFRGDLRKPEGESVAAWQQERNETEQTAVYGRRYFYDEKIDPETESLTFGFDDVRLIHEKTLDLTDPIRQNAKDAEGAALPDGAEGSLADGTPVTKENTKILSSAAPLNLQLYKNLYLAAVGWLDDGLHVQFVNRGAAGQEEVVLSELRTTFPGGEITWQNEEGSWKEYILSCTRTTAEAMTASGIVKEIVGTVKGHWEVELPLDEITPTYSYSADPQWKGTLQSFFEDWALKDTDYLLNVCADAWKGSQADPEQAVKELVDARRPAGYRINGITGWDGDPVRMLDLTVKWLGEDGGDTYTRHEVALRLQRVTPAMDAYRVDPEGFSAGEPAEPVQEREMVLLTEEAILRNALRSYPELRDHSVPINLSVEKQGIRMEVVSGCLQENIASFLVKVRDVEGKYNGHDLQLIQAGIINGLPVASAEIYRNKAENYTAWVCTVMPSEFDSPLYESDSLLAEPDSFSLNMNAFRARDTAFIDLVPLLKEHTRTEEGVTPPDGAYTYTKDGEYTTTVRMKVFDSKASQEEIPLLGNIFLSGIGWIDGQLHVQLHIQGRDVLETDSNRKSSACMVGVTCFITGKTNDEVRADGSPVIWDENNNLFPEWYEYVFNCTPDDVDQMMLNADLGVYKDMLYDDWSVEIPMNLLLQKDAGETAEKENDPDSAYQSALWTFFRDWVLGNTDRVENALTYHAEPDRPDEAEAAKEIMAAGTPRAYKLHGISGTKGDPVRTLDVTVQWDAEDGGYRYTRHALEIWLQMNRNGWFEYEINPEGFKNSQPAEAVPEEELTLVTEEAFLRDTMDAHVEEVAFDELAPIGLSMEKQGIRMEVVSGCRKGDNAYFLLTTQELSGEYSDYSCDPPHDLQTEDGTVYGHYIRLRINRAENTTTWLYCVDLSKAPLAENNALRVGIEELDFKEEREVDLLPLLELDGRTEEGITLPENYPVFTIDGKRAEDGLKVLNDEGSLDIHLDGNTYLSAIGWIGDQLHVQLVEKNEKSPDPDYEYMHLFVNCSVTGKPYEEIRVDGSPVSWFNLQNETSREEYIFNCTPEDVDSMRLYGYGTIIRANLRDDWTVEVPLDLLPDLTAAEPAAREEEAELPADDWTAVLENMHPGLLKDLKPLNLRTIEQGIRMEVISALIRDQRLYVVFSAEDLEGDRLKADPVITLEPSLDYNTSSLIRLDYDTEKQKKVTCLEEFELVYPAEADQKITLQFGGLGAREAKRVDLLPLLEKYGKDAAVTAPPENISLIPYDQPSVSSADVSMYPEILDYTQPLEESMGGTLSLSGIGWIDNKLHVQFHDADPSYEYFGNARYFSWSVSASAEIGDWDERKDIEYNTLFWNPAGEAKGEWNEYVFEISPDEAERMTLSAFVIHIEKILDAAWCFELPAGNILAEGEGTADPETAAPAA